VLCARECAEIVLGLHFRIMNEGSCNCHNDLLVVGNQEGSSSGRRQGEEVRVDGGTEAGDP
jgi:hypothetical protein